MKKNTQYRFMLTACLFAVGSMFSNVSAQDDKFASGSGIDVDPYIIETAEHLNNIRTAPNAYFQLNNDIDLTEFLKDSKEGWEPIKDFSGSIEGYHYSIKGLWINRTYDSEKNPETEKDKGNNQAFIANIAGSTFAQITHLGLILDEKGITGDDNVGGLVGQVIGKKLNVNGCFVSGGPVKAVKATAGAIIGTCANSNGQVNVSDCYSTNDVSGSGNVGGIVGYLLNAFVLKIDRCYSLGTLSSNGSAGSILGYGGWSNSKAKPNGTSYIKNCVALNKLIQAPTYDTKDTGKGAGRILGFNRIVQDELLTMILEGNYAYEGIDLQCENKELISDETGNDGLAKTLVDLTKQETYANWKFAYDENDITDIFYTYWRMPADNDYKLPILAFAADDMTLTNQPTTMPDHLKGGGVGLTSEKVANTKILFNNASNDITIIDKAADSVVYIYDNMGRQVIQSTQAVINLDVLANGLYIVKAEGAVAKIMK